MSSSHLSLFHFFVFMVILEFNYKQTFFSWSFPGLITNRFQMSNPGQQLGGQESHIYPTTELIVLEWPGYPRSHHPR